MILRASSAFLHFFKTEYLRFFYALSTISTLGSQPAGNPQSLENTAWRCIEVVVTRLTRNQLTGQTVRGFESLHLRHKRLHFCLPRQECSLFMFPAQIGSKWEKTSKTGLRRGQHGCSEAFFSFTRAIIPQNSPYIFVSL